MKPDVILRNAQHLIPSLTYHGIGIPIGRQWIHAWRDSDQEIESAMNESRSRMFEHLNQIELCEEFINLHQIRKTINLDLSSYGWKHRVERWTKTSGHTRAYIANGSFIAAAVGMGLKYKIRPGHPNAYFNISAKLIET